MVWQRIRVVLVAGVVAACLVSSARAADATPCTQTVCCTEWVPEKYQCTRTVYHNECRQEKYTAFRCECVPETRVCERTVCKPVMETQTVMRTVCECVPVCETRTVMKKCVSYQPVTTCVRKCVDRGHYECREVPCGPSLCDSFKNWMHRNDCCYQPCCQRTKTVRCWVPCKVWVETPVTCMKRVCTCTPVTCQVTVRKMVQRQVPCQVTCCKMVASTEKYSQVVNTVKRVPYEAVRTVNVCVPHTENVTLTRMVARTVQKQVAVTTCCKPSCCSTPCCSKCGGGLFRHHGCN